MTSPELFPAADFDAWAAEYDQDVASDAFPFTGYRAVLAEVVAQARAQPGASVLDVGVGTGNLAALFAKRGCEVWGLDFSEEMLVRARAHVPGAHLFLHDVRDTFPSPLGRRFDCIVSAYVFHHFDLPGKVALVRRLVDAHLIAGGRLVIADISFETEGARERVRAAAGEDWEEEPYWIAADALPALAAVGLGPAYRQVSECAGVYVAEHGNGRPEAQRGEPHR